MSSFKIGNRTNLKQKILADKRIIRLFKSKESGIYALDTIELIDELTDLHQARKFRNININPFLQSIQKNITTWQVELSSTRSRAVTIRMTCFKIKRQLAEQIKNTKGYILTTYANELKEEIGTTVSARKQYVDLLLESFNKLDYKLDTVIQLADMLIDDLKESRWNVHGITEAMKITFGKD